MNVNGKTVLTSKPLTARAVSNWNKLPEEEVKVESMGDFY